MARKQEHLQQGQKGQRQQERSGTDTVTTGSEARTGAETSESGTETVTTGSETGAETLEV